MKNYLETWVKLGRENPWISQRGSHNPEDLCAFESAFGPADIHICATKEELFEKFEVGNWMLGQGFSFGDLCFLNQVNGGDEWLTIKEDVCFESICWLIVIEAGEHEDLLARLQNATKEQCRSLEY